MKEYEIILEVMDDTPTIELDLIVDDINKEIKNKYSKSIGRVYWYEI